MVKRGSDFWNSDAPAMPMDDKVDDEKGLGLVLEDYRCAKE
jgi:hypothetical protein